MTGLPIFMPNFAVCVGGGIDGGREIGLTCTTDNTGDFLFLVMLNSDYLGKAANQTSRTTNLGLLLEPNGRLCKADSTAYPYSLRYLCVDAVQQCSVPDVLGQSEAAGRAAISGANLTVGEVNQECSDTVAQGNLISQNPPQGTQMPCSAGVSFTLSTGPCMCTIPNAVGQSEASAWAAISDAGLAVGQVTHASSDTVAAGNVISQNRAPDAQVDCGSVVDLVVSSGVTGDVDGDNAVTVLDALAVLYGSINLSYGAITPEQARAYGDAYPWPDGDGQISVLDLSLLSDSWRFFQVIVGYGVMLVHNVVLIESA